MSERHRPFFTVDEIHELFHQTLADEAVAASRRSQRAELRQPHIRNWGIATGARPYRRSAGVGWWALIATVAVCAVVVAVSL